MWAKLTGRGTDDKYGWEQQRRNAAGNWEIVPGGLTGTPEKLPAMTPDRSKLDRTGTVVALRGGKLQDQTPVMVILSPPEIHYSNIVSVSACGNTVQVFHPNNTLYTVKSGLDRAQSLEAGTSIAWLVDGAETGRIIGPAAKDFLMIGGDSGPQKIEGIEINNEHSGRKDFDIEAQTGTDCSAPQANIQWRGIDVTGDDETEANGVRTVDIGGASLEMDGDAKFAGTNATVSLTGHTATVRLKTFALIAQPDDLYLKITDTGLEASHVIEHIGPGPVATTVTVMKEITSVTCAADGAITVAYNTIDLKFDEKGHFVGSY